MTNYEKKELDQSLQLLSDLEELFRGKSVYEIKQAIKAIETYIMDHAIFNPSSSPS